MKTSLGICIVCLNKAISDPEVRKKFQQEDISPNSTADKICTEYLGMDQNSHIVLVKLSWKKRNHASRVLDVEARVTATKKGNGFTYKVSNVQSVKSEN